MLAAFNLLAQVHHEVYAYYASRIYYEAQHRVRLGLYIPQLL